MMFGVNAQIISSFVPLILQHSFIQYNTIQYNTTNNNTAAAARFHNASQKLPSQEKEHQECPIYVLWNSPIGLQHFRIFLRKRQGSHRCIRIIIHTQLGTFSRFII